MIATRPARGRKNASRSCIHARMSLNLTGFKPDVGISKSVATLLRCSFLQDREGLVPPFFASKYERIIGGRGPLRAVHYGYRREL